MVHTMILICKHFVIDQQANKLLQGKRDFQLMSIFYRAFVP